MYLYSSAHAVSAGLFATEKPFCSSDMLHGVRAQKQLQYSLAVEAIPQRYQNQGASASPALSSCAVVEPLKSPCLFLPANWLHVHACLRISLWDVFPDYFPVFNPRRILVYDLTTVTVYTLGFGKWYVFLNSTSKIFS